MTFRTAAFLGIALLASAALASCGGLLADDHGAFDTDASFGSSSDGGSTPISDAAVFSTDSYLFVDAAPGPPTIHPVAPASLSHVSTSRPTLRWTLLPNVDKATLVVCRDRACTETLGTWDDLTVTSFTLPIDLPRGVVYWQLVDQEDPTLSSPVWEFFCAPRPDADGGAPAQRASGTTLDVNGDGLPDLAASATVQTAVNPTYWTNVVHIFFGTPSGFSSTPSETIVSVDANDQSFGNPVTGAGDVNGDGFADLLVGSSGNPGSNGHAYLYLGSAAGVSTVPDATLTGPNANSYFGGTASSAGDVNGDGYADVIVGAMYASRDNPPFYPGSVFLYLGSPGGLSATPTTTLTLGDVASDFALGESLAGVGDIDGDGFDDVAVGGEGPDASFAGAVYIYAGSEAGIPTSPTSTLLGWTDPTKNFSVGFGYRVAAAGDVNGDGYADLLASTSSIVDPGDTDEVHLYLGGPAGISTTAAARFVGDYDGGYDGFGDRYASAGDVNGDGYADIVIGAHQGASVQGYGNAFVYLGGKYGVAATPVVTLSGPSVKLAELGTAVGSAGDIDGDGFGDLVVSAPMDGYNGDGSPGEILVFHGTASGVSTTPAQTIFGPNSADGMGWSLFVSSY